MHYSQKQEQAVVTIYKKNSGFLNFNLFFLKKKKKKKLFVVKKFMSKNAIV
jgi:hypothetical protein